jgi:hypothetical protein
MTYSDKDIEAQRRRLYEMEEAIRIAVEYAVNEKQKEVEELISRNQELSEKLELTKKLLRIANAGN